MPDPNARCDDELSQQLQSMFATAELRTREQLGGAPIKEIPIAIGQVEAVEKLWIDGVEREVDLTYCGPTKEECMKKFDNVKSFNQGTEIQYSEKCIWPLTDVPCQVELSPEEFKRLHAGDWRASDESSETN